MELLAYWKDGLAEYFLRREDGYLKLFINQGLQFSEEDEYRYHHSVFVLPALCLQKDYRDARALILGGGDGLGARDLIKLGIPPENIDLVDISDFMVFLSRSHPEMLRLNEGSMNKINVIVDDGYEYVRKTREKGETYDLVILDYPDPSWEVGNPVNKLFSAEHYRDVLDIVADDGVVALQATSVIVSPNVFRYLSLLADGLEGVNHISGRVNIGNFKDIGFMLMSRGDIAVRKEIPSWVFFNERSVQGFFFLHTDELPTLPAELLMKMGLHEIVYYDLFLRHEGRGVPDFVREGMERVDLSSRDYTILRNEILRFKQRQG